MKNKDTEPRWVLSNVIALIVLLCCSVVVFGVALPVFLSRQITLFSTFSLFFLIGAVFGAIIIWADAQGS